MKSLGIVGGIVFVIGAITLLVSLYYPSNSGLNLLYFISLFLEALGLAMVVGSKITNTKQTPS